MVSIVRVKNLDEGLKLIENSEYGNAACLYTTNGKTAREFKYRAVASMMGINLGIAAPMSFFPLVDLKDLSLETSKAMGEKSFSSLRIRKSSFSDGRSDPSDDGARTRKTTTMSKEGQDGSQHLRRNHGLRC